MRAVCLLLVLLLAPGARGADDARAVVERALEAERENRSRMVNYLFREEIERRAYDRHRRLVSETHASYEVAFSGGKPVYRRTSPRAAADEGVPASGERRRSHPLAAFAQLHEFRIVGRQVVSGHPCVVVESRPRGKASGESTPDEVRVAASTARFFFDEETGHRVRMEVTGVRPAGPAKIRERTVYEWAQRDGTVWLIVSIETMLPVRDGSEIAWYEGRQTYSDYRRFGSESRLSGVEALP